MIPAELRSRYESAPFEWGVSDCVQFAADAVEIYAGWRPVLPAYSSEREARRLIRDFGGLEAMVTAAMGQSIPIRDAGVCDVVYAAFQDTGPILGVADPNGFWMRTETGLVPVELDLAIKVWSCRR